MAGYLTGKPVVGFPGDIHTVAQNAVGVKCEGTDMIEEAPARYIYLKGVASTARGSWVVINEDFTTTLLDNDTTAEGRLAVATGATIADTWGWYQIEGSAYALALTALADNALLFSTATAGSVDDADDAGGFIHGAVSRSVVNETTFLATIELDNPRIQLSYNA